MLEVEGGIGIGVEVSGDRNSGVRATPVTSATRSSTLPSPGPGHHQIGTTLFHGMLPAETGIDTPQQDGCVWKYISDLPDRLLDTGIPVGHQGRHHHDIGSRQLDRSSRNHSTGMP